MDQETNQVVRCQIGHRQAGGNGGAGDVRGQHHIGHGQQVGVDGRLTLKHIDTGRRNRALAQRCGQRGIVDDATTGNIDQGRGGFHHGEFSGANGVVGFGAVGQNQHDVVSLLQQLGFAHKAGLARRFGRGIERLAVGIDNFHAKAQSAAAGNALADAAHADDAQGAAVHLGTGKHVVAPACPKTGAQKVLAFRHASGRGHQ